MKVLLLGSGGRESALSYAISRSKHLTKLYAIPGNPYISQFGECFLEQNTDNNSILLFCKDYKIDLVIIGPENFLANGLVDVLEEAGIKAFGPSKNAARIESSKNFMKDFCTKYKIPTAKYRNFKSSDSVLDILAFARDLGYPVVLKTDGLAAGKGVVICPDEACFRLELDSYFDGKFAGAGKQIVVEEFLHGQEVSFFAISDGNIAIPFTEAGDYKRVFDGDKGSNTGGMGSYSPSPLFTQEMKDFTMEKIINPLVDGMKQENSPYRGVIFAGLILTKQGIKLIEFNARFGDPETQTMLLRLETDFLDLALATVNCNLDDFAIKFSDKKAVNVVLAAEGYPDAYKKGDTIEIIGHIPEVHIFHAGTKTTNGHILTNGGRVLSVACLSSSYQESRQKIYQQISNIKCPSLFCRKDIADFN